MSVPDFVGGRQLSVALVGGERFPVLVMYPSPDSMGAVAIGPYTIDLAYDGAVAPGRHPLIVISHGSGGTHLGYRELAVRLARAGYVVLMPEHPGNNRNDNRLADASENLANRPRHLSAALDAIIDHPDFADYVDGDRAAVIGHSMGGYTGLALCGGRPKTQAGESVVVSRDSRILALVLLAPATPWFMADGALEQVDVPILMLTGEHDPHTPPFHAQVVMNGLSPGVPVEHRVIENAGHFSFMSPFPEAMRGPQFPPGNDPEGFDRIAFQETLARDVVEFLRPVFKN